MRTPIPASNDCLDFYLPERMDRPEWDYRREKTVTFAHKDIIKAVKVGDLELVKQIIGSDPSLLESEEPDGTRPLHFACWKGHTEIVQYLLDQGADITAQNAGNTHWGGTPLHVTAHANNRAEALQL